MAGLTLSKDEVRSMKRARRHEQRKDGFWAKARQSREESKQRARSRCLLYTSPSPRDRG